MVVGCLLPVLVLPANAQNLQVTKPTGEMKISGPTASNNGLPLQSEFMSQTKTKISPACGGTANTNPCGAIKKRRKKPQDIQLQDLVVKESDLVSSPTPLDRSSLDPIGAQPFTISPENAEMSIILNKGVETAVRNPRVRPVRVRAAESSNQPSITDYIQFGNPGSAATFNGTGFGSAQPNSIFSVDYTTWPIQLWTDTQIIVTIPNNMPLGKVYFTIYVAGVGIPGTYPFTVGTPPSLTSYSPLFGGPGTLVTINGSGFGQRTNTSTDYVAAVSSVTGQTSFWTPTLWTDTEIDVKVPDGFPPGMVWLWVSVAGLGSIGTNPFTVGVPPMIDCYSPVFGPPKTLVTINGSGFGSSQGNGSVRVLSHMTDTWMSWPVTTWSDSQITVAVPVNIPIGGYYITVDADNLQSIGTYPFEVGFPPVISTYSPVYGNPGTQITINGSGFGQTQGTSTVRAISSVTGTTSDWPVTSWSDTQIVVTVPGTMPLGNVYLYVQVGPLASIGTNPFLVGIPPFITSYSPRTGPTGTVITINGSGFGSSQGNSSVMLQSVTNIHTALTVVSWNDTLVEVSIPNLTPNCLSYLSIIVDGLSSIGTLPFQVTAK